MTIRYVEARGSYWNTCAIAMHEKLKEVGVKKHQLLWIDAHNWEPGQEAILSAFWDDNIKSDEPLKLDWEEQNASYGWDTHYKNAAKTVSKLRPENVISMTGSCNTEGRRVFFVFYYDDVSPSPEQQDIRYTGSKDWDWETAAEDIIKHLHNEGAKTGQIISIDCHNEGKDTEAYFSAFWNASLPPLGDLKLQHKSNVEEKTAEYFYHYQWAVQQISSEKGNVDTHSITSSCKNGRGLCTFVFHVPEEILSIDFDLDEGEITESKPKVVATKENVNCTSVLQTITFQYTGLLQNWSSFWSKIKLRENGQNHCILVSHT